MKEEIVNELQKLIPQINGYYERFGKSDVRASFLDGHFQIIRTYYCSYYHLESDDILLKYREIYPDKEINHDTIDMSIQGHKNLLNSFLILNSWSNFELGITLMANSILDERKRVGLLSIDYARIMKIFSKILIRIDLSETIRNKLSKFNKFHLSHVPMTNKYGNLLKLISNYPDGRSKKLDRKFLEFYGRLRNCVHSNYIYYGRNSFEYRFEDVLFRFTNGELLSQDPIEEDTIFNMSSQLKDIFTIFAENIDYPHEIHDPSHEIGKSNNSENLQKS